MEGQEGAKGECVGAERARAGRMRRRRNCVSCEYRSGG